MSVTHRIAFAFEILLAELIFLFVVRQIPAKIESIVDFRKGS